MPFKTTHLGKQITAIREEKGLSRYRLAKDAGINLQTLINLEAGTAKTTTWETLQRLATALGVSTEQFRDSGVTPCAD